MSVLLTILIGFFVLILFCLANIGVGALFDNYSKDGCMVVVIIIVILIVVILVLYGLRACVS